VATLNHQMPPPSYYSSPSCTMFLDAEQNQLDILYQPATRKGESPVTKS